MRSTSPGTTPEGRANCMTDASFSLGQLHVSAAPRALSLNAALLTTYDPPDLRFLAEDLFPSLLRLALPPDEAARQQQVFVVQLERELARLGDQLLIISSGARGGTGPTLSDSPYRWMHRCLRQYRVGRDRAAVQHSKLWLLHWVPGDREAAEHGEMLEIVVSSANLTREAFRDQIQAAWRVLLPLHATPGKALQWGVLPAFLEALGKSAGCRPKVTHFINLLMRADCPKDTRFIASIPGVHDPKALKRHPWGYRGLSRLPMPKRGASQCTILSPFIGDWSAPSLTAWASAAAAKPEHVRVAWLSADDHLRPEAAVWKLPPTSAAAMAEVGMALRALPRHPDDGEAIPYHSDMAADDMRWGHGKLYEIRRGRTRWLVLTSANFSPSAWGRPFKDGLLLENFELGVALRGVPFPLQLGVPLSAPIVAETTKEPKNVASIWAHAEWNGEHVAVHCRCGETVPRLLVRGECKSHRGGKWVRAQGARIATAVVPWSLKRLGAPVSCTISDGSLGIEVPVLDVRPSSERHEQPSPGLSDDDATRIRDEHLFERYGGAPVAVPTDDPVALPGKKPPAAPKPKPGPPPLHGSKTTGIAPPDSYELPAFRTARRYFAIVDTWVGRFKDAQDGTLPESLLSSLRSDGAALAEALNRQSDRDRVSGGHGVNLGARLAAEEIRLRLKGCSQ